MAKWNPTRGFAAVLLCFGILFLTPFSIAKDAGPGDVDGDGSIRKTDALLIRDHLILRSPLEGDPLVRADANQDGGVVPRLVRCRLLQ